MYIAQYYAAPIENKEKIIVLAELLDCEYWTIENIIAVQVDNNATLAKLKRSACRPYAVQAGMED